MKDIDFDELDRAVNSLISPSGSEPTATPTTPVPSPSSSVPVTSASDTPSPAPSPLAERRTSGRFMDVVHPSSDMRPVSVPPRPTQNEVKPAEPTVSAPAPDAPKPATTWPDPIDVHEAATKDATPEPPAPEPTPSVNETPAPLESPFLSDAKVEKRPLGAFSNEVHESGPAVSVVASKPDESPDTSSLPTTDDQQAKTDHPIQNDTPMPAELQPGLLSIEANEDPKVAAAPEVAAPTSITQQYTEQPSTGDKPTVNVFNAEAYKKPQGVKKKKSGWLVIVWILLLLVVGAGIGAAVYFFVLPRL